jgi:hypothetical protein
MSVNKYGPHMLIIPEDDANRQIANGFITCPNIKNTVIQVLPPAKGWGAVLEKFEREHCPKMTTYTERRILLLIDFDNKYSDRISHFQGRIPPICKDRVFILGVATEPEKLKSRMNNMSLEKIGTTLTENCPQELNDAWNNELLAHNMTELKRMVDDVKSFLFV